MIDHTNIELQSRYRGAMLGLAAGDALGTTLEFELPGSFEPVDDIVGGGPFFLEPGQWTDDTSMALCLAESLVERGEFDPADQMHRYLRWYRQGYLSCTEACFDIGGATRRALERFELEQNPYAGDTNKHVCGNGSLMRLAPVPLAFANHPQQAHTLAAKMSRTTHAATEPMDACRYYAGLIVGALHGADKNTLLSPHFSPLDKYWDENELTSRIDEIAAGSFKLHEPPQITGSGYVVRSMEAALWAFWKTDNFRSGAIAAVNLGDDADTTGAIYGQLAGAFYGYDQIPENWRNIIAMSDFIVETADGLLELASHI